MLHNLTTHNSKKIEFGNSPINQGIQTLCNQIQWEHVSYLHTTVTYHLVILKFLPLSFPISIKETSIFHLRIVNILQMQILLLKEVCEKCHI